MDWCHAHSPRVHRREVWTLNLNKEEQMRLSRTDTGGYEWRWSFFMVGVDVQHDGWENAPNGFDLKKCYLITVGLGFFSFWFHAVES